MSKQTQGNVLKRLFSSRLFLIVGFIVLGLITFSYIRAYYQHYQIEQEITRLKEEADHLEVETLESMEILQYVMSDAFVEEKARTELNMKKPGEQVVYIEQAQKEEAKEVEQKISTGQYIPNPVKWWYYFTHKSLTEE
ncbi:septum formation initiator family protein [Patescibacteria group bacterium]|nr:septum formation initiator family protein [Patescibacteria group bacterium]MBU1722150.1 septum formation initiator family protein [Patescibacteria group bacterium]MBU1901199.1 septum formation initiator family protein [Patescibacteria group bacterium]